MWKVSCHCRKPGQIASTDHHEIYSMGVKDKHAICLNHFARGSVKLAELVYRATVDVECK